MPERIPMTLQTSQDVFPARQRYYKDCRINDVTIISERYALVEVQLPHPFGGHHEELVSLDTIVEIEQ